MLKAVREARNLRQRVDRGENPLEDRTPPPAIQAVSAVLDEFIKRYVRNKERPLRSADEIESAFNRLVKPRIGKLASMSYVDLILLKWWTGSKTRRVRSWPINAAPMPERH